jgi:Domain of unknown function (DUF6815)
MTTKKKRIAILFPADARELAGARVEQSRLAGTAEVFVSAGVDVVSAPFVDEIAGEIEQRLEGVGGVLVWFNPIEAGRDRSGLNAMLRSIAAKGVFVSAHPDVVDKMGTKEVLYRTKSMEWGCDTRRYGSVEAMSAELPASLRLGPRVLKQMRGQSGDGVWKVALVDQSAPASSLLSSDTALRVRHAKRGSIEERMSFGDFIALCRPYFAHAGAMIDQPYQARLHEGMIRCYVVRDRVEGFGEQLVNALHPAPAGKPESDAPQPGPRLYFPPGRADFQRLKDKLERDWIPEMCRSLGIDALELPVLWDADFLRGPKNDDGADTYVLCEINVSSVYPFPPSALAPLVSETLTRIGHVC